MRRNRDHRRAPFSRRELQPSGVQRFSKGVEAGWTREKKREAESYSVGAGSNLFHFKVPAYRWAKGSALQRRQE